MRRVDEMLDLVGLPATPTGTRTNCPAVNDSGSPWLAPCAPSPHLMLLDEPFASLDPNLRSRVRDDVVAILRSDRSPRRSSSPTIRTRRWRSVTGSR